jgi:hypothetical protein
MHESYRSLVYQVLYCTGTSRMRRRTLYLMVTSSTVRKSCVMGLGSHRLCLLSMSSSKIYFVDNHDMDLPWILSAVPTSKVHADGVWYRYTCSLVHSTLHIVSFEKNTLAIVTMGEKERAGICKNIVYRCLW